MHNYRVKWKVKGQDKIKTTQVLVESGNSIPKVLGLRYGLTPDTIKIVSQAKIGEV